MTARTPAPLAFSTLGCPGMPIGEVADIAARYGFSGVELRAASTEPVHPGLDAAGRRDIVTALAAREVRVLSLASYVRVADVAADDDTVLADAVAHAELAADLGASFLRVFPGGRAAGSGEPSGAPADPALVRDKQDATAIRRLRRLGTEIAGTGVVTALETHDSHPAGSDLARILRHCPGVLAIWDTLHTWRSGEAPADTLAALADRLAYIQVKDAASFDDVTPLPPGSGALPLHDVADTLRSSGYRGWVSWEYERAWFPDTPSLPDLAGDVARWMSTTFSGDGPAGPKRPSGPARTDDRSPDRARHTGEGGQPEPGR